MKRALKYSFFHIGVIAYATFLDFFSFLFRFIFNSIKNRLISLPSYSKKLHFFLKFCSFCIEINEKSLKYIRTRNLLHVKFLLILFK